MNSSDVFVVPRTEPIILDTNLNMTDSGIDVYDESNTYAVNDEVQKDGDIFISLKDGNGNIPIAQTTDLNWKYKGKVNYLRAFDYKKSESTTSLQSFYYIVEAKFVDTIGFSGLEANSVKVELFDRDDEIMDNPKKRYIQDTYKREVIGPLSLIMAEPDYKRDTSIEIYPYFNMKLKISIEATGAGAKIGYITYGRRYGIGNLLLDNKIKISTKNLFNKSRDTDTGVITTTQNIKYKEVSALVEVDTTQVERTEDKLASLNGQPCLFIFIRRNTKLPQVHIFGYHTDFDTPIGLGKTQRELTIEGAILS